MPFLQGHFLIASPHLSDPNFLRSVVLMVQHDEQGAFGLVLNRPLKKSINDIWQGVSESPCDCELPLYAGGPVEGPLVALHTAEDRGEEEVIPGVYFSADKDLLDLLVRRPPEELRIFNGYSGWGSGQLEAELEAGGWLTMPATPIDVFGEADEVWDQISKCINLEILAGAIDPEQVPEDPSMN